MVRPYKPGLIDSLKATVEKLQQSPTFHNNPKSQDSARRLLLLIADLETREPEEDVCMVVDDEPVIADTLKHILNMEGFPSVAAYDGDEAVEKARTIRPKFILMGVMMPRMDGITAAICIVQEQPECRICLFSGSRYAAELLEDARLRGYEFPILAKPMHPSELLSKLSEFGLKSKWAIE